MALGLALPLVAAVFQVRRAKMAKPAAKPEAANKAGASGDDAVAAARNGYGLALSFAYKYPL